MAKCFFFKFKDTLTSGGGGVTNPKIYEEEAQNQIFAIGPDLHKKYWNDIIQLFTYMDKSGFKYMGQDPATGEPILFIDTDINNIK